jgi:mgtE-like transporter
MISLGKSKGITFKIFREALAGYTFDIGGIVAGTIIALQMNVFSISPWSIAVYPAILSARGIIGGLFSGRLSTAFHLGTIFPRIFKNTKSFRMLVNAVVALTFEVSVIMSLFSTVFGSILWGTTLAEFPNILAVISATMSLGLIITLVTMGVSSISFKYGLDSDVFLYPAVSAISDVLITLFYIFVLSLFFSPNPFGQWLIVSLGLFLMISALISVLTSFREKEFTKTLKESFFTLIFVAVIVNITGTILSRISASVTKQSEVYIVFPALMAIIGDVGAVVGSTATTKLAVGLLDVSFSGMRNHLREIFCAWTASLIVFVFCSFLSLSISGTFSLELFLNFTFLLLVTNVIAASAIILISYAVALLTFQKGLDPDNFVIPIESVLADNITSIALLVTLFLVSYMV